MLITNLKLAIRNILRNKLYTSINVIGLGVTSAFCILVYLYVKNEQSFDRFHNNQDRLFRVEVSDIFQSFDKEKPKSNFFSFMMKDEEQKNMVITPAVLAVDLKRNFPEIENAIRLGGVYAPLVKVGNKNFGEKEDNLIYADADFFSVFNFPLIVGNPKTVLSERNKVVISERLAEKYFGKANPIGKVISIPADSMLLTVGGVAKNFPANSSLQYDMIIPIESDPEYKERINSGLNTYNDPLIIRLKENTDIAKFRLKLDAFAKNYFKTEVDQARKRSPKNKVGDMHLFLRPFADAHYNQSDGWGHYTDLKNIYQLVCLAVVILFIACLNYILLTLTSAISRSQDVGIRKTIGARRIQIILQYYTETQLLAFISVIVGLLIATACLPFFSSLTGTDLQLSYFSFGQIAFLLFALAVILGLVAGIYPALAMSGLKPLNIIRSFSAYKLNPVLSRFMVVVQFTICVILIISAMVINKQMRFINKTSMGFDKDQVVLIKSPYSWSDKQKTIALKNELYHYVSIEPSLQDMTAASFGFGGGEHNGFLIGGEKMMLQALNVDYNYFQFNKIPIVEGRTFSRDIATDSVKLVLPEGTSKKPTLSLARRAVVVNETLYNLLGKPELGVINEEMGGVIIGVCKDYHTQDLTQKIGPMYHFVNKSIPGVFWIKIKAGQNIPDAMAKIKNHFDKLTGNLPFDYTFMDQEVAKSYEAYLRWMTTITTSCILAIIIACLGLFGLSGLTTLNRTKEIGIRKVLGASVSDLFMLLNRGTLYLTAGSFIIAAPIAFYLVHGWLDNFAYRIKPDWILFTIAGLISVATAFIAVSYHTLKAASGNPVDSLRSE